jgi:hypothetical protein
LEILRENMRLEKLTGEVERIVRKFCKDRNIRYSQFNIVEMRDTILEWDLKQQLKELDN